MAKRRWMIAAFILTMVFLLGYTSFAYYAKFGDATHDKITTTALALVEPPLTSLLHTLWINPLDYPDLYKFRTVIRMVNDKDEPIDTPYPDHKWGCVSDVCIYTPPQVEDAHYNPANTQLHWMGNENEWEIQMDGDYAGRNFLEAYRDLGFTIHLRQDSTVPAHTRVIFHGLKVPYTDIYPGGPYLGPPTPLSRYCSEILCDDNFEHEAGNLSHNNTELTQADFVVATPQQYEIKTNQSYVRSVCSGISGLPYKFWLSDAEDTDASVDWWGAYGIRAIGCGWGESENDYDWYPGDNDPTREIVKMGLYRAAKETSDTLKSYSEHLPPLVLLPSSFFSSLPLSFNFMLQENRKPGITMSIIHVGTGKAIQASLDGAPPASIQGISKDLYPQPIDDMTKLPFEKWFTLSWDGRLADGSLISSGAHQLDFQVRDADHNLAPFWIRILSLNVSTTPDITAPTISAVMTSSITSSGATITWTTSEAADSQVEYGLTTAYGYLTPFNPSLLTSHSVPLSGLTANTLYHYRVKSKDAAGNPATSDDFTFTTAAATADLTISMTDSPDPVLSGGTLAYRITLRNIGSGAASSVTVADTLPPSPASVSYISCTASVGSCSQAGGTVTASLGTIAAGASATVTITVAVVATVTFVTNTAVVSAVGTADKRTSATTTVNPTTLPTLPGGGPPGGYILALAIDPRSTDTLYVGAVTGEGLGVVFKSTNGGTSWTAVNSGLTNNIVLALAIDPSNPATIYAGTSGGVFKSPNGGISWTAVNSGLPTSYRNITTLVIDPSTPSTLYTVAGYVGSIFKSIDGGASWTAVNSGLPTDPYSFHALAIDPSNPATIYAGGGRGCCNPFYGVFKSTNGGASWTGVSSDLTNIHVSALAIDPSNPATIYAGTIYGIFKSTNGVASWTKVGDASSGLTAPGWTISTLVIDPSNPATLYAGGTQGGIFKSANGGASWTAANSGITSTLFDVYALAIDPSTPATLYAGTSGGGVFKSANGGTSWTPVNTGIPYMIVKSLAIDPSNPATIYAGTGGGGTRGGGVFKSSNGGTSWTEASFGITYYTEVPVLAIDPSTPTTLYAGTSGGGVFKSTNGGISWTAITSGLTGNSLIYVNALAIDPSTPTTLYTAIVSYGVFKSTNGGASWTAANSGLTYGVGSLAIDPANPSTIYAGTYGVFKSTNGGASWTAANSGLPSEYFYVAIDPSNPATLYAGDGYGDIFKSANGGASWTMVRNCGCYPTTGVYALAIDPSNPATIYAGTYGGVFRSTDGGTSWSVANSGLTTPYVGALAIDPLSPSTLYAGTVVAGVFKSTDGAATWKPTGANYGNGAPPATAISKVSGDNQTRGVGQALRYPFVAAITNASGVPVAGIIVTFAVTAGGGSLLAISVVTDSQGVGSTVLTLGPNAGTNTVTATADGLTGSPLTFNATGAAPYLVGDVAPLLTDLNGDGDRDDAGEFGDGVLNNLDLIQALRAVVNLSRPLSCSDRFDAMDAFPADGTARGGDGELNNLDLIRTLRRVVNLDQSRPQRVSRGIVPCP